VNNENTKHPPSNYVVSSKRNHSESNRSNRSNQIILPLFFLFLSKQRRMDTIRFRLYAPIFFILFCVIGWFSATGLGKGQYVRILDVLIYGPYLVYLAMKDTYTFSMMEKLFLLLLGATTISYNLKNFLYQL
jgi:hypothetical protein